MCRPSGDQVGDSLRPWLPVRRRTSLPSGVMVTMSISLPLLMRLVRAILSPRGLHSGSVLYFLVYFPLNVMRLGLEPSTFMT